MSTSLLKRKPREVEFSHRQSHITAGDIFTMLYSGLEPLVTRNIQERRDARNLSSLSNGVIEQNPNEKARIIDQYLDEWRSSLPGEDISAKVTFDDNSRTDFKVTARKNFSTSTAKLPSIVYLHDNDGHVVILREARSYDPSTIISALARDRFGNKFDINASSQFMSQTDGELASASRRGVMYIPEPQLLLALECLYEEGTIERLTPHFALVGTDDTKMWYLRNLLPSNRDIGFDLEESGNYLGTLHAVGLMEILDRQLAHYCRTKSGIVNFDPDFMTHTTNKNRLEQHDMGDVEARLKESEGSDLCPRYNKRDFRRMKQVAHNFMNELKTSGIDQETIFQYLKKDINPANGPKSLVTLT
jgi:hypothetical protein